MASGGTKGQKGVGILLHRSWKHAVRKFRPVSGRVCCVDIAAGAKKLTLIAVYMPHGSCPDNEVEQTYILLSRMVKIARTNGLIPVICGDWNAVVGRRMVAEDPSIIGDYGMGSRNARGRWMAQWAGTERMRIINTCFDKGLSRQWTYIKGHAPRQIDYGSIDVSGTTLVKDAEACDDIAIGMDHRALKITLQLPVVKAATTGKGGRAKGNLAVNWQPRDEEEYQHRVDQKLAEDGIGTTEWLHKALADRCTELERMLADIATDCRKQEEQDRGRREKLSARAKKLITERRQVRKSGVADNGRTVKQISKDLQRELRAWDRLQKRHRTAKILQDCKGIQKIALVNNNDRKMRLTSVRDAEGEIRHDRQEIVDVFATFYEALYARRPEDTHTRAGTTRYKIPEVKIKEVSQQLQSMKNGKSADSTRIVVEMLKAGGENLTRVIADLFNEVLLEQALPPAEWKHTRIKVLLKKGDPHLPGNYRPISILPILYKLFSRILHQRLKEFLDPEQCIDQAGFRTGFNCEDHLLTIVLLYEKLAEQNLDLWVAAVDFEKAFDSVSHESIWSSLHEQNVPPDYVEILQRLYAEQTGQIIADRSSRSFNLGRGTKQGDPLSPALFNAVLESIMRKVKYKWEAQKVGVKVGTDMLTNLRFADDLLLIGRSRAQARHMLEDLAKEAAKVGLTLHMGKTKILSSRSERRGCLAQWHVDVLGEKVEVLPGTEGTLYGEAYIISGINYMANMILV